MASVGTYKGSAGQTLRKIQFTARDGSRKTIYLGEMSKRDTDSIKVRVESLFSAQLSGHVPDDDTTKWVAKLSAPLAKKLAGVGLIDAPSGSGGKPLTVEQFCDAFIAGRPDAKPRTVTNYEQTKQKLVDHFGEKRLMTAVTALDADRFRAWMKGVQELAENTTRTHVKNAKLIFGAALRGKLIAANPFAGHKTAVSATPERMVFVDRPTIKRVMDACPTARWRAIVALCRFGGLRCPSEVLTLKWDDIDWERGRMTVRASKTEHHEGGGVRIVPLFPEVRLALEALMVDPDGAEYIISCDDRSFAKNLRTVFLKILKKAKIEPWGKPFQNLRSSRETELAQEHPIHVVVAWLGNSLKIANKHYLQVRDTDFEKAIGQNNAQDDAVHVGNGRKSPENDAQDDAQKPLVLLEKPTKQGVSRFQKAPPAGVEPAT